MSGYGYVRDALDPRDHVFGVTHAPMALPQLCSLRAHMPPVYDQGQLGSCTGNGIAAVMEYQDIKEGQPSVTPSRLFIYYHERLMENTVSQDAGAQIRDGIKVVANLGVPPEHEWPYDISKFAVAPPAAAETDAATNRAINYARVNVGGPGAPLRSALHYGHPVVFGFSVIEEFESLGAGDYLHMPTGSSNFLGGHCVVAVGYDFTLQRFPVPVVECRNSWGASWGEAGYFYMDARYFNVGNQLTSDFWVIRKTS